MTSRTLLGLPSPHVPPTCPATSPATLPFLSLCFSHGLPHAVLPTCQGHFHVRSCCFLYPNSFFQIVPCLNPLHSEKGFSKSLVSPNYLKYYSILLLFNPLNLILLQNLLASWRAWDWVRTHEQCLCPSLILKLRENIALFCLPLLLHYVPTAGFQKYLLKEQKTVTGFSFAEKIMMEHY